MEVRPLQTRVWHNALEVIVDVIWVRSPEQQTSASLLVTSALLVVTMFATRNKCLTTSNNKNLIRIVLH